MKILLTGGAGYIGSHTAVELLNSNYQVIIIDNFINSKEEVIDKIKHITSREVIFYKGDIRNKKLLTRIFRTYNIGAVIHFASLKAVDESINKPLDYYNNNVIGSLILLEVMKQFNCKKIIFSSSASVYGKVKKLPIKENTSLFSVSPYGSTKIIVEMILEDLYKSDNSWSIFSLRYFNPIGAHESNLIGENPNGEFTNLMPYILKVALKKHKRLTIFGNDYETLDGTCIRDYIHVKDLALGHLKALKIIENKTGIDVVNLGTGKGYSVLEIIKTFELVNKVKIPYVIGERRDGDIAVCYADIKKAKKILNFCCSKTLEDMCRDAYSFYKNNLN